jgi:hypothetical protein
VCVGHAVVRHQCGQQEAGAAQLHRPHIEATSLQGSEADCDGTASTPTRYRVQAAEEIEPAVGAGALLIAMWCRLLDCYLLEVRQRAFGRPVVSCAGRNRQRAANAITVHTQFRIEVNGNARKIPVCFFYSPLPRDSADSAESETTDRHRQLKRSSGTEVTQTTSWPMAG